MADSPAEILRRNLLDVFAEPSRDRRDAAIDALYDPAIVFQDGGHDVEGVEVLKDHVAELLARFDGLEFTAAGEPTAVGDLGRVAWILGPPSGEPVATGTDVGLVRDGRLVRLWTFLDAPPA